MKIRLFNDDHDDHDIFSFYFTRTSSSHSYSLYVIYMDDKIERRICLCLEKEKFFGVSGEQEKKIKHKCGE